MVFRNRVFLSIVLLLQGYYCISQLQNIKIPLERLSTQEGLISNRVTSIIKDSMGFYWYGTSLGLHRHDGNQLELFRHELDNPNTLPDDYIKQLIVANPHVIAGLTVNGLIFTYDYRNPGYHKINRITLTSGMNVPFIGETIASDGRNLYIPNLKGEIQRVDLTTLASSIYLTGEETKIELPYVTIFHNGALWVGSKYGLYRLDTINCTITKPDLSFYASHSSGHGSITVVEPYDENHFLLSCHRASAYPMKGIVMFNFNDFTNYPLCLKVLGKNVDDYFPDIIKKIKGPLLFIKVNNLSRFLYNLDTHQWDTLSVKANHTRYLNSSSLNCAFSEPNGRFRIGSNQGIYIHLPEISMFEEFYPHKSIFYARQWTGVYRDDLKNLYVGTPASINCWNTRSEVLTTVSKFPCVQDHHRANQQPSLIEIDSFRFLVLTSYLYTYDIRLNSFTLLESDSASLLPAHIQSDLFPYTLQDRTCYFVRDGRLFRIDLDSLQLIPILITDNTGTEAYIDASGLCFDSTGHLWITTYNKGLLRLSLDKGNFTSYILYKNECLLNDIIIDSNNIVWIASSRCGLIKLNIEDPSTLRYVKFSKNEGYISSDLFQIMEDQYGRIWSSSSYGINYFEKGSRNIFNFSKAHGIEYPHNYFRGKTKDKAGNFYVSGGINITKIDPRKFQKVTLPPPVYITQFQINHTPVAAFWKDTSITLTASQNNFAFQLSTINHIHPKLNKYKYQLENFHPDWISTTPDHLFIPFTNLKAGSYVFKVIASNHEGVWNTKGINIRLQILPPVYETWWFRLALLSIFFGLGYYIVNQRTQRMIAQQRIEIEKKMVLEAERTRISRDMHDDLGSGLSAIHLLSNYLNENAATKYPEFSADVDKISKSSEELNERIREIIWTVNIKDDSLHSLISFIRRFAHEMHDKTRIPILVSTTEPIPDLQLNSVQRKHVFLCVKEAVNNALKHGQPSKINIQISNENGSSVLIEVMDDGQGFNTYDQSRDLAGNGLSNMRDRMADVGGTCRIDSNKEGTTVTFNFPVQY